MHLFYTTSDTMRADIFTKGFDTPEKWGHALDLINHIDPKTFFRHQKPTDVTTFVPPPPKVPGGDSGGIALPATDLVDNKNFDLPRKSLRQLHRLLTKAK